MNILGVGPAEFIIICIIALIVFGPGRLPELARTLGKAMRELRRMSLEVTAEFAKELRDVEAISREVQETKEAIQQAADIKGTLAESLEPALTAGESKEEPKEEPKSSDVQETTTQAEAEKVAGDKGVENASKENGTEDHE
jgi:Tat protein translocase TatB subunit